MVTRLTNCYKTVAICLAVGLLWLALPLANKLNESAKAAESDVTVEHTVDKANAKPEELLSYTLKINNVSSNTLSNMFIKSRFTNGTPLLGSGWVKFVDSFGREVVNQAVPDDFFDPNGANFGDTLPGDKITITYQGKVNPGLPDREEVKAAGQIWWIGQTGFVRQATTVVITPKPVLCAIKKADKEQVAPGGTIEYTIEICNEGNVDLNGILVRDELPNGPQNRLVAYIPGSTILIKDGQTTALNDDWMNTGTAKNIQNLRPGMRAFLKFKVRVNDNVQNGTVLENVAQVRSDKTPEQQCANKVTVIAPPVGAPQVVTIQAAQPTLRVQKLVVWDGKEFDGELRPEVKKFAPGEEVKYRIGIENPTDQTAKDVKVEDRLQSSFFLDFVKSSPEASWNDSNKILTLNIGEMVAKRVVTWEFVFKVRPGIPTGKDTEQIDEAVVTSSNAGQHQDSAKVTLFVPTAPAAPAKVVVKPKELPRAGAETAILASFLALGPLGLVLRRFKIL